MNNKLEKIFNKKTNVVIGAIHFPPLLGYPEFPGIEIALENALIDLYALEQGGVDGIIIENNYDIPHHAEVGTEVVACLTLLAQKIKEKTKLPIGISVLWNDYKTALSISKVVGLEFVRIPVFVDTVKTSYGIMEAKAKEIALFQTHIGAENVALFTDIHVKHSEIISKHTILESAQLAIEQGSDALIVTGKWTGDAPDITELQSVFDSVKDFPILCGSGVNEQNIKELFKYSNGGIVSTSLKEGVEDKKEINIKPYDNRISLSKVTNLMHRSK